MSFPHHHAQKKTLLECAESVESQRARGDEADEIEYIHSMLAQANLGKLLEPMRMLGQIYGFEACDAYGKGDRDRLAQYLSWAVDFRSLNLRLAGMYSEKNPDDASGRPRRFHESLHAVTPTVLSRWPEARACAIRLIEMAEKDERLNPIDERRLSDGTVDAFLVHLFADAFERPAEFHSLEPIVPAYRQVLDAWRSKDADAFAEAMSDAADFHLTRAKDSNDDIKYEFNFDFERVFPTELLAVQALRKRDGTPAFTTGHPLIDGPWSVIETLPRVALHPLARQIEERLANEFPLFR